MEKEGLTPLLDSPLFNITPPSPIQKLYRKGLKGTEVPLTNSLSSPLMKGRGIKGEGLLNNLLLREGVEGIIC